MYKDIDITESIKLIDENKDLLILDVRTEEEYKEDGYIKNAKMIPLGRLLFSIDELDGYEDSPILVYCRRGSRSMQACEILEDNGFTELYNMMGGFSKLVNEGPKELWTK